MHRKLGWIWVIGLLGCATPGSNSPRSASTPPFVGKDPGNALPAVETVDAPGKTNSLAATWREMLPWRRARVPVSESTLNLMADYIARNDLQRVHLEFRTETPSGDWQRLKNNNLIHPVFKYSAGTAGWGESRMLWASFWGKNHYSPFTDTLHINSDDPVGILSELAYAKVLRDQKHPGTYAFASRAPLLSVWNNSQKTSEMIAFARSRKDWDLEKSTYRKMYPGMLGGTSLLAVAFVPVYAMPLLDLGVAGAGVALAEWKINLREKEIQLSANKEMAPTILPDSYSVSSGSVDDSK